MNWQGRLWRNSDGGAALITGGSLSISKPAVVKRFVDPIIQDEK
jgi:hypothetical protein